MYKIVLRQDGFFEYGREQDLQGLINQSKQELKKKLSRIGKKKTINDLEQELSKISTDYFKGRPYVKDRYVKIDGYKPQESFLLGEIRKTRK